jgi:hypothetical protein
VSLSIAGTGALPDEYLHGVRALADWLEPVWVSDHLCWTSLGGHQSHDLLPVAYTAEVLEHVASRVARVQDFLGRRLLLENPSAYVAFRAADMDEAEFFAQLCRRTGCGMLLDVNNLCVNAANLAVDPLGYVATLPSGIVGYLHLAGHAVLDEVRIDTHDAAVPQPVWALFDAAVRRFPEAGVIVERDDNLPPFEELVAEVRFARARHAAAVAGGQDEPTVSAREPARVAAAARWATLQRGFWDRLVDKPPGFDHRGDPLLRRLLDDGRPVSAARGMRVYSDAYAANVRQAVATNFPALARVLSAADLEGLAAAYARRWPPRGADFRGLGLHLAEFVRSYPFTADYGIDAGVLSELVALEQAQLEVQDEVDEPPGIPPEALGRLTAAEWETASFEMARALRIVHAAHDVLPVIEAVARGEAPDRPAPGRLAYLVCRAGGVLLTERLRPAAAIAMEALLAGRPFGEACAEAESADVAVDAVRVLVTACARGLVLRVRAGGRAVA